MDESSWLKFVPILSGFVTPIVVAVLGIVLLRHIEGIKAETTKQSAFHVKWADEFFDTCQNFLRALERQIAILIYLTAQENKNDDHGIKIQHEHRDVNLLACELQLRIRRLSVFAPKNGEKSAKLSEECFSLVNKLIGERQGNLEPIFQSMNEFNRHVRFSHAEMLALDIVPRPT